MNRLPVRRTAALLLAGCGLTAHADPVPLAAAPRPAPLAAAPRPVKPVVQLLGVREVAAVPETARGTPNTPLQPFDPFFDPGAVSRSGPAGFGPPTSPAVAPPPGMGSYPTPPGGQPQQQPRGVWGTMAGWTGDRAKAIKTAIDGPPPQTPDPRVGGFAQPAPTQPMPMGQNGQPMTMAPNQPFRGTTSTGRMAYAGNPAYRWYGWGTTTPGANPYAPTGDSPSASAQWYAMSGATPGAFPVPVTNPFRDPPGSTAPAYAGRPAPPPRPATVPPPAVAFDRGPVPIAESAPFRYLPPDDQPAAKTIVPTVPAATTHEWRGQTGPLSAKPKAEPETVWQPVQYTAPATPAPPAAKVAQSAPAGGELAWQSVSVGAKPAEPARPATLQEKLQVICGSDATNFEMKKLGTDGVIVRFNAPSDAAAERVAKAVSELTELKPFTVTFDVVVSGK